MCWFPSFRLKFECLCSRFTIKPENNNQFQTANYLTRSIEQLPQMTHIFDALVLSLSGILELFLVWLTVIPWDIIKVLWCWLALNTTSCIDEVDSLSWSGISSHASSFTVLNAKLSGSVYDIREKRFYFEKYAGRHYCNYSSRCVIYIFTFVTIHVLCFNFKSQQPFVCL